jgi:hypothetical protein
MPEVIYDKINGDTLWYTKIYLQLTDQSLCYPKGVLEDAIVQVGQSYVSIDFVVWKQVEMKGHPSSWADLS